MSQAGPRDREATTPPSREVRLQPYLAVINDWVRHQCVELDVPLGVIAPELAATDAVLAGLDEDPPVCRECGNGLGPYGGQTCLDCLEAGAS